MRQVVTRDLGPLVARGNTSSVFAWGEGAVVKVLLPGIPDSWADREAETTDLVHAAGLPAPAVLDLVMVEGRPGIVFERVTEASMWDQMVKNPEEIPTLSLVLAEMQAEVNETSAPTGLPRLSERLRENIQKAEGLTARERRAALFELDQLPDGDALCHFDVHPNNVLMGADKPVIIDWFDAAAGDPAADIVRSSLLMRQDAVESHLDCVDPSIISQVHNEYLTCLLRTRDVDSDDLMRWEPTVMASRLAEPLPDTVLAKMRDTWRARHSGDGSSLLGSSPRPALSAS